MRSHILVVCLGLAARIGVSCVLSCPSLAAVAITTDGDRKAIQLELDKYAAAWKRLDRKGVYEWGRDHLATGWTQNELDGTVTRRDAGLREAERSVNEPPPPGFAFTRVDVRITKTAKTARGIRVWVTETREADYLDAAGRYGPKGMQHKLVEVNKSLGDWTRSGGRWLDQHEAGLSQRQYLDGKPAKVRIGGAPADSDTRDEIQAAYDAVDDALIHRDREGVLHYFLPGTKYYRETVAAWNIISSALPSAPEIHAEVQAAERTGDAVMVTVRSRFRARMADPRGSYGPKGREHVHVGDFRNSDTWVKTEDGWKMKESQPLSGKLLVDGTPRKVQ